MKTFVAVGTARVQAYLIMFLNMFRIHCFSNPTCLINISKITPNVGIANDTLLIALQSEVMVEMRDVKKKFFTIKQTFNFELFTTKEVAFVFDPGL